MICQPTSQGTTGSSEAHHLRSVLSLSMSPTAQKPDPPYSNDQYVKKNLFIEINKGLSISALKDSTNCAVSCSNSKILKIFHTSS